MASEAGGSYKYSPLLAHPHSIRLLRLLPASRAEDPVQCRICNYSLTTPARTSHLYECLSYVWGDVENKQTIQVDDAGLAVTQNLHGALRRLRDAELDRVLWVDAVCINQDDVEERSAQVKIMTMIYAHASRVVVWLGEEADGSTEAMELLREEASRTYRAQKIRGTDEDIADEVDVRSNTYGDNALEEQKGTGPPAPHPQNVTQLLKRPWFQRVWVLQEIAAARVMIVLCGFEELTGACFFWGLTSLLDWLQDPDVRSTVSSILYLLGDTSALRVHKPESSEHFRLGFAPLSQLLDMFRLRSATDRRDKVFALLGLTSSDPVETEIVPDYRIEWEDLFRNLARSILGKTVEASWIVDEKAEYGLIHAKGRIVGCIESVEHEKKDRQVVAIMPTYDMLNPGPSRWVVHTSAAVVHKGDVVCILEGSKGATIFRPEGSCFRIIVVLASFPSALTKYVHDRQFVKRSFPRHDEPQKISSWPFYYGRNLILTWTFDVNFEWSTPSMESSGYPNINSATASSLSNMIQVAEDLDATDTLQNLLEQCSPFLDGQEKAPDDMMQHFQDLDLALRNWSLYLQVKQDLYELLHPFLASIEKPLDYEELDLVTIRSFFSRGPEHSNLLIKFWYLPAVPGVPGRSLRPSDSLNLAFRLDAWGGTLAPETILALVDFVERDSSVMNARFGGFPTSTHMEVVQIILQASAQHLDWGLRLAEGLVQMAKGNPNRMFCLVRALIICSAAPFQWKETITQAILATHSEELLQNEPRWEADWASLEPEQCYRAVVDFLWDRYLLQVRDFVGIAANGSFQSRNQLMQKFVRDYQFWKSCYDGDLAAVQTGIVAGDLVDFKMPLTFKDLEGRWCRWSAIEAVVTNRHVDCCLMLFNHGCEEMLLLLTQAFDENGTAIVSNDVERKIVRQRERRIL